MPQRTSRLREAMPRRQVACRAPWTLFALIVAHALCSRMRSVRLRATHRAPCVVMPQRTSRLPLAPWTLVALIVARALCCRMRSVCLHATHRAPCAFMPQRTSRLPLAPWTQVALIVARALCCRMRSIRLHATYRAPCALMPQRTSRLREAMPRATRCSSPLVSCTCTRALLIVGQRHSLT
eukprot:6212098-Pleurochrysis_carterae.AAC.3